MTASRAQPRRLGGVEASWLGGADLTGAGAASLFLVPGMFSREGMS